MKIEILGQVRGGKNNMKVSKFGHHYPDKKFIEWKNMVMPQIKKQYQEKPIDSSDYEWRFIYTPQDKRRRDMTAILDAIFHVLEKCNVIKDDCLIKYVSYLESPRDKENPSIVIYFQKKMRL